LWNFKAEQKVFQIGGISIGGIPGQRPVVLVGTLFYHGHKIVKDENAGIFDEAAAEALVKTQDEMSDKTGNPAIIDIVSASVPAMKTHLEFVADRTKAPLMIDSPSAEIRAVGLAHAKEQGILDRVVYNSINPSSKPDELKTIQSSGVSSAVLLAYNMKDFSTAGRISAIKDLVSKRQEFGIEKPLIDTCVLDLPTLGSALRAMYDLKDELGFPVGCGAHNAVALWKGLKSKMGEQAVKPCLASVNAVSAAVGADFILYGPIDDAKVVFPAVAMVDTAYSQLPIEKRIQIPKTHPRYKIG
jgi:[methyl-Co(III) methoxylated-aromatic-compound-specific corrinoid protein]---tetrahydromethanopterin methyltransferase